MRDSYNFILRCGPIRGMVVGEGGRSTGVQLYDHRSQARHTHPYFLR